jgi:class 3 adenylate cyclase
LRIAKQAGAKIYADGSYRIIVLSPTLTKKEKNNLVAVKVAKKIEEQLKAHNKKFKGHVFFGLGVGSGEIISEIGKDGFKFSSVGNVISSSKRIAEESEGEVLLSDDVRRAVIETIKTEKLEGKDLWKISRITEREKHSDFLRRFIERGKKE